MRLKSLEVQGYKSFANKVKITFDKGLTAIVGPNGSGKSNVVDAIRWVLGEQSYLSLRGRKTADMIFAGSDGRARLSMAVATLLLDNTARWLPIDFSEVTISRRAYRSGENEYYLNGSRVRLRDVSELLAQGGLSRQTYTVIGQGMIDQILALQSAERRRLFEEAAGIVFHRQKREETLSRLETTQSNLLRVHDLVQEIEPQLKRLSRQAQKATEYTTLMTDLADRLTVWYGYRWHEAQRQRHQAEVALQTSEQAFKVQQTQLTEIENQIAQLRAEQAELRHQVATGQAQSRQVTQLVQRLEQDMAVNQERTRQFTAQRQEMVADLEVLTANLAAQKEQIAAEEATLAQITTTLQETETELTQGQQQLDRHQHQQRELLRQQTQTQQTRQARATALTERQAELSQLVNRQKTLAADQDSYEAEIAELQNRQATLEEQQTELTTNLWIVEEALTDIEATRQAQRQQLTSLNEQIKELQGELAGIRRQQEALKAQQNVLGKLRRDMAGYQAGVRAILQANSQLTGILGPVSQIIQAPPDLEVAIEVALGGRLQDVVVESFADAQKAIDYLKRKQLGRATLLPLDTLRVPSPTKPPRTPGVIGLAADLVETQPHLRRVAEFTLNRTVVVEDLPTARRTFEAMHGGFNLVTRDGELMRSSGAVTGGQGKGSQRAQGTFLAREREWRELPHQLRRLQQQEAAVLEKLQASQHQIAEVEAEVAQVRAKRTQTQQQQQALQKSLNEVSRAAEQAANALAWQADLQTKAETEVAQLAQRQATIQAEMAQLQQEQQTTEAELAQLASQLNDLSAVDLVEAVSQLKTQVATVRERRQKQQTILANHRQLWQQLEQQIESKRQRIDTLAVEQTSLKDKQVGHQSQIDEWQRQLDEYQRQTQATEQRLVTVETNLGQQEQREKSLRQQWQRLEAELRTASIEATRRQDETANLRRQIEDDLGLVQLEVSEYVAADASSGESSSSAPSEETTGEPDEDTATETNESAVIISPEDLPVIKELPAGLEAEIKQLRQKVRRLGNINPEAPREHAALNERHHFLTSQMADLEAAADNLRQVIEKLDAVMHETFVTTFQQVSTEFKRYFKIMFGGGEANILLTDPDNLTNTGVDIVVRPPGKRLQSMALLSGGERSLTAQALIFALLSVSPTPFVIFDEVDAMLDEANVDRFRDALVGLSQEIQFIIVTHNRKTIEAANTLYGVSMGSDSVSQIYSLKLDEWDAQVMK